MLPHFGFFNEKNLYVSVADYFVSQVFTGDLDATSIVGNEGLWAGYRFNPAFLVEIIGRQKLRINGIAQKQ